MGFFQLIAQNLDSVGDMVQHLTPNAIGGFVKNIATDNLHLNQIPEIIKTTHTEWPQNAANWVGDQISNSIKLAEHPAGFATKIADFKTNLGEVFKYTANGAEATVGSILGFKGLKALWNKGFNKVTDAASDKAADKATQMAIQQLNLVSTADNANVLGAIRNMFGFAPKLPGEIKSAYVKHASNNLTV